MASPYDNLFAPTQPVWGTQLPPRGTQPVSRGYDERSLMDADPPQGWADLSTVLGGLSSGAKADRALEGQFTQNYDRLMLEAQQEKRAQETDALRKLHEANYVSQGGSQFKPGNVSVNGRTYELSSRGLAPPPMGADEKAAAGQMSSQMLARLKEGGSYNPTSLDNYAKPGTLEKIGSYGGAITGGLGVIDLLLKSRGGLSGTVINKLKDLMNGGNGVSSTAGLDADVASAMGVPGTVGTAGSALTGIGALTGGGTTGLLASSGIPIAYAPGAAATNAGALGSSVASTGGSAGGLGGFLTSNAIPLAGAAAGAYGVARNDRQSSTIGSGALSGASIGTMIMPGIGTAVGAGAGALAGYLRHKFGGPDKLEQRGRTASGDIFKELGSISTPSQLQEARNAGWEKPEQALAVIVLRDKLIQDGLDPKAAGAKASQYMNSIWSAERHGGNAVQDASSPIDAMLARRA